MSKNNYIIRDHRIPEIHHADDEAKLLNTTDILKKDYDYIYKSILDEQYKLEHTTCDLFKELLHEDKVVGFVTYDFSGGVGDFSLNEIYVLPEFRGNNYLKNEIDDILLSGSTISIYEPTHRVIELLINYGYAEILDKGLVASAIGLDMDVCNNECNTNFTPSEEWVLSTTLYDLNLSACIFLQDISSENTNIIVYSRCLEDDDRYYHAKANRENMDTDYFDKLKEYFLSNYEDHLEIINDLEERKPKPEFDIDKLVGRPPNLSPYLEGLVTEEIITEDRALDIQKQMLEEFEENLILPESLLKRVEFLAMEDLLEDDDELISNEYGDDLNCPYCGVPVNPTHNTCHMCGFALTFDEDMDMGLGIIIEGLCAAVDDFKKEGLSDDEILDMVSNVLDNLSHDSKTDGMLNDLLMDVVVKYLDDIK